MSQRIRGQLLGIRNRLNMYDFHPAWTCVIVHLCEIDWTTETRKRATFQDLSLGQRPRQAGRSEWLYQGLRNAILEGRLRPGARVPSTRNLALQYHIARSTAVYAFEQLKAEGYIESIVGAGNYM